MTSLSRQLAGVRESVVSAKASYQGRASLFLSSSDAAGLDFEVVLEAAVNGLSALRQYDERFGDYMDTLFYPNSVSVQRELKTAEENKEIDKEIRGLLKLLSLYATEPSSHKVLEYLFQRYRINELNVDALMSNMIHIHDTKIFARIVQLCEVKLGGKGKGSNSKDATAADGVWAFLDEVKRSGIPLQRVVLVKRMKRDNELFGAVCKLAKNAVKLVSKRGIYRHSTSVAGADRVLSFFATVMTEFTSEGELGDAQMRTLTPILHAGLTAPRSALMAVEEDDDEEEFGGRIHISAQWRRAVLMVLAQVSQKTALAQAFSKTFMGLLAMSYLHSVGSGRAAEAAEVALSLAVYVKNQGIKYIPAKVLHTLFVERPSGGGTANPAEDDEGDIVVDRRGTILPGSHDDDDDDEEGEGSRPSSGGAGEGATIHTHFFEMLKQMSTAYETKEIVHAIVSTLTSMLLAQNQASSAASEDDAASGTIDAAGASQLLVSFLTHGLVAEAGVEAIVAKILQSSSEPPAPEAAEKSSKKGKKQQKKNNNKSAGGSNNNEEPVLAVVRCIVQKYASLFDRLVDTALRAAQAEGEEEEEESEALRAFLRRALVDAPYRAPMDTGTTMLLSLMHVSPTTRVQALETFAERVPDKKPELSTVDEDGGILFVEEGKTLADYQDQTPDDLVDILGAVRDCMVDQDPRVAQAAWSAAVVKRVAIFASYGDFVKTIVRAVEAWVTASTAQPKDSEAVLCAILRGLGGHAVLEVLNKAQPGWAVASSTTAEAGWAVMPPINPLLPLDTQTPVPAHSLQVPEWLCMTVLGLSMGGRVASEEVQLTASQLGRDLGAAAYVHLLAELPIKSALTKAEDSTARTELIAVAMAKGISSGAGAADIMAITKVSQAVETLQHIVLYLLARLQQLDATSSISGAHLLTGELPAMRSLLNVVLRTVDILVDGELDEAEAAKASKSKKGGGAKQKGGERDSRRTSLGVSTSSVSAVRQVLPAVAMLLAYLADECATSAALSAEACSLLERVVNQARTAGFALFEKFRPVLPAAETGKLSSYLSSDSVAFPAFAPLLQGRAVAAGTGADGMDVEEDEDDEDGDGPRALVDHLGCRLLLVALGSAKESLVTLTHTILATFFEDCAVEAVLSACLSEHTPSNARAGALFVLGEYVGTLQQQGKTAVAASSAARFMAIQTACALAVCSANALERGGAIHVCQQLEKLPKTLKLTALSDKTAPLVSTEDLIYFGAKVAALADTAAIDGSAAFAAFTTRVMGPCGHGASKTAITTHGRVQSQILYAAVTCTTVSPTRASVLVKAAASTPLSVAWPYLQRVAEQLPSGDDGAALSKALLDTIAGPSALNGDDGDKTAAGVVEWLCRNIEGRPGASGELFRTQSVQLLAGGWASRCLGDGTATAKLHTQLFQAVMTEQVARPGHQGVLLAIAAIDVDTASIVEAVKERTAALETASGGASLAAPLQNLTSVLEAVTPKLQAPHREGEGEDEEVADLSRLLTLSLGALNRVVGSELGSVMGIDYCRALLMDMGSHCLARIPRSVLTNGGGGGGKAGKGKKASGGAKGAGMYTTARVEGDVEAVLSAMQQARSSHAQASAMRLVRALAALQPSCVPACIRALGALLSTAAMDAPGGINTSSGDGSATEGGSKTNPQLGVVGGVLGSLVTLMVTSNDDTSAAVHPQEILIPLCTHFDAMGPSRKSALIKTALQAVGAHALPATVNVLLLHALTAFESEQRAAAEAREASINDITTTTSENETAGFVLLSRNAQRQARRSLQASAAEEYFRIASEASSRMPATAQVYSLVASVQAAAAFLEATVSPKSLSSAAVISVAGASGADNSSPFSLDVAALHAHHLAQGGDKSEQRARGVAAALSLMNLEHVFSVVENPSFHKQVVRAIDASPESAQRVQEQFVVIFDHLLQLIAAASALADGEDEDEEEGETVTVMFGAEAMEVSLASLGRTVNDWCLDVLKSMHRLLDTAAFVSILQELVSHEQARVRQTALYILGQRLDRMTKGRRPSTEERVLFLELATQLRKSICEAHPNAGAGVDNSSGGGGSAKKAAPAARARSRSRSSSLASMDSEGQATADLTQSRESRITLAQSALMCLDSLTRHIGKARDWTEPLTEALGELTELATALLASINNAPVDGAEADEESGNKKKRRGSSLGDASAASSIKSSASAAAAASLVNHELKLAASLFLCCGTIVKAIGPRALAQLGPLMDAMLQLTERQTKVIKALGPSLLAANDEDEDEEDEDDNGDDDKGDDSDKEEGEKTASVKASALLLRSVLASLVSVVSEVPSFAHPYLRRVLLTSLSLREVAATRNPAGVPAGRALAPWLLNTLSVLVGDVDQCLSTVAQQIPPRLSIPAFRAAAPSLLGFGHSGAARLALLLGEVWAALDRPAILASMGDNGALCALLLDYRRVHGSGDGDVVQGAAAVEEASCEAIVTLCLKLTEGELKALLARLAEWRDSASVSTTGDGTGSVGASGTGNASRGVAFYRLMAALGERLQALFCPSMGPYWGHVIDTLGALSGGGGGVGGGENNSSTSTSSKNKGGKKRKSAGGEVASPSNALWQREQVQLAQQALEAVRVCCTHDSNDFVDEERYNAMMPAVVGLLPITLYCNGDGGDDQYSVFVKGSLAPCLVALALSVGKDTLWKPLTHHVLMATRHTRSAVRLAALHTLHTLFMEVGEEFLVLLPECLPFLSELMEDDSSDVCDCTSKVVRYIEELSGEKLDQYLQ